MKTLSKILFAALLFFYAMEMEAQQDPQYTQYFWNPLSINAAYAGSNDVMTFTVLAREQWVGLDGRPRTQTFSIHSPLKKDKFALGLSMMHDQLGPSENISIFGDFAYRMEVSRDARLAFGLKAGVNMWKAEIGGLGINQDDPLLANDISNSPFPNFGASVYYWGERYFAGFSVPKLLENELKDGEVITEQGSEKRHFFLLGGYVFELNNDLMFKPTAIIKYVSGAPISADFTANFLLSERLWLGGAYRHGDSVGLNVSYLMTDQLRAGYGYDFTLTELQNYNSGSHELMVQYDLRFITKKTMSPRYF